ncbi:response regulator [Labilibacter sediminis]|nr:response regulator [Labilibacter sediminis]
MDRPKVLYVDDEEINLLLFEINLRGKYHVLKAEDGLKGLEVIKKNPDIKVVVSDMKMPYLNGIEFITKAKELAPNVCYFILTGFEITDELQAALDKGLILNCFRKPFNMNVIDEELEKVI